jgi:putative transposase
VQKGASPASPATTPIDGIYTAIAHPVRRQLLDQLLDGEQSVHKLAGSFPVSRPAVSQHLRVLLDAGLVAERQRGCERHYRLQPDRLREVARWLRTYERLWQDRLGALTTYHIFRLSAPAFRHGGESRVARKGHDSTKSCRFLAYQTDELGMEHQSVCKTFKYKLLPTPEQEQALATVLWRCRELYNAGLQERKAAWEKCGVSVTFGMQSAQLPGIKEVRPEYRDINAQVLQDVLHRLDRAFAAFFRRLQAGARPGYPRFQAKDRYNSFTYPQMGEHGGAALDGSMLTLSKIGGIRLRLHRPLQGTPKTVTISREADGWYACISCADVPIEPLPATGQETGIDVGLKVFLVTADGAVVENPRHHRTAERQLAKAQRRVSRRTKGSKRRRKAVRLLARTHQQVKRQRRDFHHKTTLALLRTYDTIYLEDLPVRNLVRNPYLAKSISDAGWAAFRTILEAKAACAGRQVIAVPAQYTSQDCSGVLPDGSRCLQRVAKSLSVRTHVCPSCGLVLDRDENAALNIRRAGQARQAPTWPVGASVA